MAQDLAVAGSVEVNQRSERVGKGGGIQDGECALGRELGFVDDPMRAATTVRPLQRCR
jgi:5-formyltetrahydrofolate cyclo-ligase